MSAKLRAAMRQADNNTETGRSKGKDVRGSMEQALEDATREYLDLKAGGASTADKVKGQRGVVRGLAMAMAIMDDPDDGPEDAMAVKAIEKEYVGRVKD